MEKYSSWLFSSATLALALAFIVACGGSTKKTTNPADDGATGSTSDLPSIDPTLCDTAGKRVETFDLNRDRSPDVWKLYKNIADGGTVMEVMTCKQVDLDHDGRKDYVAGYYEDGKISFEKIDLTYDGKFDIEHHYHEKSGKKYETFRSSNFENSFDIKEIYNKEGTLSAVRRDRNDDKKPDVWEQYDAGELVAILYDDDFDGKVDRRERVKEEKKPKKEADLPAAAEVSTDKPVIDKPVIDKPVIDKPVIDKPVVTTPVVETKKADDNKESPAPAKPE